MSIIQVSFKLSQSFITDVKFQEKVLNLRKVSKRYQYVALKKKSLLRNQEVSLKGRMF